MASANLEFVRSIYAAWERGDFSSADWAHPDIEYVHADGLAAGSWTGLAGMTQAFLDFINASEEMLLEGGSALVVSSESRCPSPVTKAARVAAASARR